MSELKAIRSEEIYNIIEYEDCYRTDDLYYLKSEADKVIAELKKKIEEQKRLRDMALASVPNALKVAKIIQHSKYKRCLAMAMWCDSEMNYWYDRIEMEQCQRFKFYNKWHNRWLELAERFK